MAPLPPNPHEPAISDVGLNPRGESWFCPRCGSEFLVPYGLRVTCACYHSGLRQSDPPLVVRNVDSC